MRDQILAFMSKHIFCTISTVTADAKPEAAFVGFSQNDALEIVVGTSKLSRKYQNLQQNPHVAVVIADTDAEVQYEGVAEDIGEVEYKTLVEGGHFVKLPGAMKYRDDPHQVFLKIQPTWLRFVQHGEQDSVTELTEF